MKRVANIVMVSLALLVLSSTAVAAEHWVLKPCGSAPGACFTPVTYPVLAYAEAGTIYGWGPAYDDPDGVAEGIILFPNIPREGSWEKLTVNGVYQTHYINSDMPFLWCDARYFPSTEDWIAAIYTWGFNPALLDIVNNLSAVWTNPLYKDIKGCWVGVAKQYHETFIQPAPDRWNWTAQLTGTAQSSEGTVYDVRMKLKVQVKVGTMPLPEGVHFEFTDFYSSPVTQ